MYVCISSVNNCGIPESITLIGATLLCEVSEGSGQWHSVLRQVLILDVGEDYVYCLLGELCKFQICCFLPSRFYIRAICVQYS